jgi:hypothetical protein
MIDLNAAADSSSAGGPWEGTNGMFWEMLVPFGGHSRSP